MKVSEIMDKINDIINIRKAILSGDDVDMDDVSDILNEYRELLLNMDVKEVR